MGDTMKSVLRHVLRDERGAAVTEYVAVTGLVTLGFMMAMLALGPRLVESYQKARNRVAHPFP